MSKIFKINTVLYAVNKTWKKEGPKEGAKVIPVKVKGFEHQSGKVIPILQSLIKGMAINACSHKLYESLEDAVEAIS